MVAKFLDHNNREFKQRQRRRQREQLKSNKFILAKQQLCTCITLYWTFLSRRCRTASWNFLISRACFMEKVNTTQKFLFLFLHLNTVLWESTLENFANIWQLKWNWRRSIEFETVRCHFLREISVCGHPEILLPWERDVTTSPLYYETSNIDLGPPLSKRSDTKFFPLNIPMV